MVWASVVPLLFSVVHAGTITITCDNDYELYVNGVYIGSQNNTDGSWGWDRPEVWSVDFAPGRNIVAVFGLNWDPVAAGQGIIAQIFTENGTIHVTDASWRVAADVTGDWAGIDYDDAGWSTAFDQGPYDQIPWSLFASPIPEFANHGARWIWNGPLVWVEGYGYADANGVFGRTYFRKEFMDGSVVPADDLTWGAIKSLYR
jgi:hypothetical protein